MVSLKKGCNRSGWGKMGCQENEVSMRQGLHESNTSLSVRKTDIW